jgi:hypothetical protein
MMYVKGGRGITVDNLRGVIFPQSFLLKRSREDFLVARVKPFLDKGAAKILDGGVVAIGS